MSKRQILKKRRVGIELKYAHLVSSRVVMIQIPVADMPLIQLKILDQVSASTQIHALIQNHVIYLH